MKQPHILCAEGDLAERAIVVGDPARVARVGELLENTKDVASNREFTSLVGEYQGESIAVMSTGIGGPSTAIAIEEIIRIGVKKIIRVGSCGSMQKNIKVGDLIIPDNIVREEGTTHGYIADDSLAKPDPVIFASLKNAAAVIAAVIGVDFHIGTSITIDALYAKSTLELKAAWAQKGALAQEMEGATVLVVSHLRGAQAGCVFLAVNKVEGDLEEGIGKYTEQSVSESGEFIEKEKIAIKTALEALVNI